MLELQNVFIKNLVDLARAALTLAPPAPAPASSPLDQLATARELIAFARELAPEPPAPPTLPVPPGAAGWAAIAERLVDRLSQTPAPAPAPVHTPPGTPGAPIVQRIQVDPRYAPLIPYVGHLISLARRGGRPELQAAAIADQLPPSAPAALAPMMAEDGYPSTILVAFPSLEPVAGWITPFLYSLRSTLFPDGIPAELLTVGDPAKELGETGNNGAGRRARAGR